MSDAHVIVYNNGTHYTILFLHTAPNSVVILE